MMFKSFIKLFLKEIKCCLTITRWAGSDYAILTAAMCSVRNLHYQVVLPQPQLWYMLVFR